MWIQNVPMYEVIEGSHINPGPNSMLIQIVDPDMDFPKPAFQLFKEVRQFKFLDIDARYDYHNGELIDMGKSMISQTQADQLVHALKFALAQKMNVIVHCHMGVCRSGAVCEVGVMMGFEDTDRYRAPNIMVKGRMLKTLGWSYDEEQQ